MTALLHSKYREFPPPHTLSNRLVCVWTQSIEGSEGEYSHAVLPDGCVDIVLIGSAAPVVAGPATERIVVNLQAGSDIIGFRFRPGWATSSLGVPASAILNHDVLLNELWGTDGDRFAEEVCMLDSVSAKLHAGATALARRMLSKSSPDRAIQAATLWLTQHPGGRVRDLARSIGLSNRHLQRLFQDAVGYGPKMFQRIMRFQRLLALSSSITPRPRDLARLAGDLDYSDQAHMCREVREFANETPQAILMANAGTLAMSDLFNTPHDDFSYLMGHTSSIVEEDLWSNE